MMSLARGYMYDVEWKGGKVGSAVSPMGLTMADQEGNLPRLTNCTHSEKSAFRAKVHRLP